MQPVAPGQTALSKCLVWRPRPTIFGISVYPGTPVDSSAWITSSSSSFGYRSMYISRRSRSPPPRTAVSASTRVIRLPFVPRVLGGRQFIRALSGGLWWPVASPPGPCAGLLLLTTRALILDPLHHFVQPLMAEQPQVAQPLELCRPS